MLDNRFKIVVKDTGIGIKHEDLEKIFNPFFTTNTKGSGLGLAMVRRVVDLHKGEIKVASEVGKGSEFTVELPILQ
jgi:signal transduction histidine kinase